MTDLQMTDASPALPPNTPVRAPLATQPLGLWPSLQAARRNLEIATRVPMISGRTGIQWHMVMEPGAIRRMLLENLDNYPKSTVTKNLLRPAIGESLFIAEGAHWRWQRRAAAPTFSHRNMQTLAPIMGAAAERSAERIGAAGRRAVDLYDEMVTTTFDVISDVTFSGGEAFDRNAVHRAIDDYIVAAGKVSLFDMLGFPGWVPRPGRLRSSAALKQMKRVADRAIDERVKRGPGDIPDLLDLLMQGEDPDTRRRMDVAELRDNLLTFIVAGHETTALTLSWALYLLAWAPEIQDRVREEITAAGPLTAESLSAMPLLRCVVDETLRLYPPAGLVSRTAQEADVLCGRDIAPGDTVMIPIYALHRHHALWRDPDAFDPDRFAGPRPDRYGYLPFGDGPRICIGASFAIQEAMIVLATLLSRFRFARVEGCVPKPVMIITLRPEGGVWLTAKPL